MAKDEEEPKTEAPPPPKKGNGMLIAIILVVVLLVGGGAAFFLMSSKKKEAKTESLDPEAAQITDGSNTAEGSGEQDELEEGEEGLGAIFPLDPFVVNLDGGGFVRTQIQLEFNERDIPKRLYGRIVPIRDAIIVLLTKKKQDDVLSVLGKDELRKEIKDVINEILKKEDVKRIYFTQFVVQ